MPTLDTTPVLRDRPSDVIVGSLLGLLLIGGTLSLLFGENTFTLLSTMMACMFNGFVIWTDEAFNRGHRIGFLIGGIFWSVFLLAYLYGLKRSLVTPDGIGLGLFLSSAIGIPIGTLIGNIWRKKYKAAKSVTGNDKKPSQ